MLVTNDPCERRPKTGTTPKITEKMHGIVLNDRRVGVGGDAKFVRKTGLAFAEF